MTGSKANGQFRRILVCYDGSQDSEKAFQVGLSIAKALDARLEILAVIQPGEPPTNAVAADELDHARNHYELALRRIMEAANEGRNVETSIVVGHPAEQIIKRAEQSHSDLGTSKFKNLDIGSVSEHVLAHAPCPVLVTR